MNAEQGGNGPKSNVEFNAEDFPLANGETLDLSDVTLLHAEHESAGAYFVSCSYCVAELMRIVNKSVKVIIRGYDVEETKCGICYTWYKQFDTVKDALKILCPSLYSVV